MTPAALRALGGLMEAQKARDLAILERLVAEDRTLEAEIATLAGMLVEDAASAAPLPPDRQAARIAWIDGKIAAARRRRSALAPEIARARAIAVQSLGRARALDHLAQSADRVASAHRAARDEREAPPAGGTSPADVPKLPHVNPGTTRPSWR